MALRFLNLIRQLHTPTFVISKAAQKDRREITRMMQDVFYKTDPSSVYSKVSEVSSLSTVMNEMALESLEEDVSFVARENEKDSRIFGLAINGVRPAVIQPPFMENLLNKVKSKSERTLLELWRFLSTMPPDSGKYFDGAESVFEVRYLVVDPSHRNRGVATALVNRSKKEAAARGHKFIRIDCTSHFTARIASAIGMHCIFEMNYQDYKNPSGEYVFQEVIFPHTKVLVYAGKI